MNNCISFSITSNCPEVGCDVNNFCGNTGPYGGFQEGGDGLTDRSLTGMEIFDTALSIAPNPANDLIHVSCAVNPGKNNRLYIRNSMGALVKMIPVAASEQTVDIDTGNWPVGLYLVYIEQDGAIIRSQKVAIQR